MSETGKRDAAAASVDVDASTAWQALTSDTDQAITVHEPDGTIVFANDAASRLYSLNGSAIAGKRFQDLFKADNARLAAERLELIRRVAETGRSLTVDGMINGQLRRTTYRPVAGSNGRARVLAVSRPPGVGDGAPDEDRPEVYRCKHDDPGVLGSLTHRELEILRLIGEGLSTADIAKKLHRSVKTVEWHRVALGNKLGITNRVELARIAIRSGIVTIDDKLVVIGK